jgi:hypothetical protein
MLEARDLASEYYMPLELYVRAGPCMFFWFCRSPCSKALEVKLPVQH